MTRQNLGDRPAMTRIKLTLKTSANDVTKLLEYFKDLLLKDRRAVASPGCDVPGASGAPILMG